MRIFCNRFLFALFFIGIFSAHAANIQKNVSLESKMKAVFIYNFTNYIGWPAAIAKDVFTIGVIGPSDIVVPLKEIAETKTVQGVPIRIRYFETPEKIDSCQILFVSSPDKGKITGILAKTKGASVLTVGDAPGLAAQGIAINFVIIDGKIRFEINTDALGDAGLKVSSHLLKLGILVEALSHE
jgi:hypothetical protein